MPAKQQSRKKPLVNQKRKKIDVVDENILDHYRRHPHATVAEVANEVHLKPGATHKRVARLIHGRYVRRGMTVDLHKLGYRYRFRIDVKINPHVLKSEIKDKEAGRFKATQVDHPKATNPQQLLAQYIMDLTKGRHPRILVEDVVILLGDAADLSITTRAKSRESSQGDDPEFFPIFPFVTEVLREIPGVENTSTCTQAWSCAQQRDQEQIDKERKRKASRRKSPRPKVPQTSSAPKPAASVKPS